MKKIVVASCAGLLSTTLFAGIASADMQGSGMYAGVSGIASMVADVDGSNGRTGANLVDSTADMGTSYGVALRGGRDFGTFRAELEFAYRDIDVDSVSTASGKVTDSSGSIDAYSLMINGLYDIEMDGALTPYVMVGVGALRADGDIKYTDDNGRAQTSSANGTAPAGQIGIGVSYGISSTVDLVGGYTFMGAPTNQTGDSEILKIHSASIGVNYKF